MADSQKSLKKNTAFNFIKAIANFAFPLITFPYASRVLNPDGIGKVNFANSIIEYFVLIAALGVTAYATREAARIRDDKEKLTEFCRSIFTLNLISTAVAYALMLTAIFFVPKFSSYRILLIICSTKILFTTIGMEWLYSAFEDFRYITIRSIVFQIISLVFLFVFVRGPDDYNAYAIMGILSNVGSNIFNFIHSRKYINLLQKTRIKLKKHFKASLIFFGVDCAAKLHNTIDAVILGFMMDDEAVGYYSAATKISRIIYLVIATTLSTFTPRAAYYLHNDKIEEYKEMTFKCLNLTFFFTIPATMGLILLASPLMVMFCGDQYLPAVTTMQVLAPTIFILGVGTFFNQVVIVPQRKEKISLWSQIVGAVLNTALNILLIPKFGIFGAAIATVFVEAVILLIKMIYCFDSIKSLSVLKGLIQCLIGTALMSFAVYFTMKKFESLVSQIFISVTVGCTVYAVVEILLRHQSAILIIGSIKSKVFKKKSAQ